MRKRVLTLVFFLLVAVVPVAFSASRPIMYVPTGTGFGPITAGTQAATARAVDLSTVDVTGTLPAGNQAAQSMGGDVSGTTAAATVAKVNGATVPAGGSLTTGAVLRATGTASLGYGAVNLASTSAVTGTLPAGNQAAQSMGGDASGTTAACTVSKVNGASVPAGGALTTGQVLRVTGGSSLGYGALDLSNTNAVTGTLPGTQGGSGWITVFDCDLSAQGSQTLTADGNYTICGVTWTKENSTNDRVAMAVTNGTGLVIQPKNASGAYTPSTTRTAPLVWIPFSGLSFPTIEWQTQFRVWAYASAVSTVNNNTDNITLGIDNDTTLTFQKVVQRRVTTNVTNWTIASGSRCNTSTGFTNTQNGPGAVFSASVNGTFVMYTPSLVDAWCNVMSFWGAGVSGGNWPSSPNLHVQNSTTNGSTSVAYTPPTGTPTSTLGIVIAGDASGASDNASYTLARVRLDVKY